MWVLLIIALASPGGPGGGIPQEQFQHINCPSLNAGIQIRTRFQDHL